MEIKAKGKTYESYDHATDFGGAQKRAKAHRARGMKVVVKKDIEGGYLIYREKGHPANKAVDKPPVKKLLAGRKAVITRRMVDVNAPKIKDPPRTRKAKSGVRDLGGGIVESRVRGRTRRHLRL